MTHPLPLRPLTQRNPAWRLYGDALIAIDAVVAWRGGPPSFVRCRLSAGRPARAARVASTVVRFGPWLPAAMA